jgi:hypothetical protein
MIARPMELKGYADWFQLLPISGRAYCSEWRDQKMTKSPGRAFNIFPL